MMVPIDQVIWWGGVIAGGGGQEPNVGDIERGGGT